MVKLNSLAYSPRSCCHNPLSSPSHTWSHKDHRMMGTGNATISSMKTKENINSKLHFFSKTMCHCMRIMSWNVPFLQRRSTQGGKIFINWVWQMKSKIHAFDSRHKEKTIIKLGEQLKNLSTKAHDMLDVIILKMIIYLFRIIVVAKVVKQLFYFLLLMANEVGVTWQMKTIPDGNNKIISPMYIIHLNIISRDNMIRLLYKTALETTRQSPDNATV